GARRGSRSRSSRLPWSSSGCSLRSRSRPSRAAWLPSFCESSPDARLSRAPAPPTRPDGSMTPFALEIGLAILMLVVFGVGLVGGEGGRRRTGALTALGLVVLVGAAFTLRPWGSAGGGAFVSDPRARVANGLSPVSPLS